MRLWHQELIPYLNRQHILAQWRECIAMLGNGWGKKHKTIDYAFQYSESYLIAYSTFVISEMLKRGYKPNQDLIRIALVDRRGKTMEEVCQLTDEAREIVTNCMNNHTNVYLEHNEEYLQECIKLLVDKGYSIDFFKK